MPDDTTAAATTATTAAATATAAATTTAAPWHGLTTPEDISYASNKGWKAPADVIKSYQGAEKLIGRDPSTLLVMPKLDDPAAVRAVYSKLGMPESPDKYEFDTPKDMKLDDGYLGWARENFHKIGLTGAQAKALTAEHNKYIQGIITKETADYNLKVTAEKAELQKEWGGGYERMAAAAKTAATSLGFTGEMIDALEREIGYSGTYKFFAELGKKMGEDSFVAGSKTPRFDGQLTPDEAKQQWEQMKADPVMIAALKEQMHPNHASALEKQTRLFRIMFPEK